LVSLQTLDSERDAVLVLSNGVVFRGKGIGATKKVFGELVFSTGMVGYNATLTDCSNRRQIYLFTYPLIGNYGVPAWERDEYGIFKTFESDGIKLEAVVVNEACREPSHYESIKTFEAFLKEFNIPGIEGIDTRHLTIILRSEGTQMGLLQVFEKGEKIPDDATLIRELKQAPSIDQFNLAAEVSTKQVQKFTPPNPMGRVVIIDCGVKNNIMRNLAKRGMEVLIVPYNSTYEQIMSYKPNGVLISNGPGDPKRCLEAIAVTKKLIETGFPTMGICLGNQIMGLAAGGNTFKLKFGHRGGNKPVRDKTTGRLYITSQNHQFAVDPESVRKSGFKILFENIDDNSVEGIYHETKPIFAVQFHPEGTAGPFDTLFLFDKFMKNMGFAGKYRIAESGWIDEHQNRELEEINNA
jgi:carbamoyl-phosphate synthase small subunit